VARKVATHAAPTTALEALRAIRRRRDCDMIDLE
jgi:hypothetical protein